MKFTYSNLDDIIEKVTEDWNEITNETLNRIIDGHCSHFKKACEAEGSFITD